MRDTAALPLLQAERPDARCANQFDPPPSRPPLPRIRLARAFSVQGVSRDCAAHLCDGVPSIPPFKLRCPTLS